MNQGKSARAHSQGAMLAVFLVFIVLASLWLFTQRRWWLPELASIHGVDIDRVFLVTLTITGVLFVLLQGVLAYFAFRYGDRRGGRARYWIRPVLEKRFAIVAGIIIAGVDVTIFALGESQWFRAWGPSPPGTPVIEVMGEQFVWNFRYAGPDGVFGKTDPALISSTNPFGLDKTDPAAKDDTLSINQLHLPEGKPIRLRIRSHDVIHSFFLPYQRIKQDAVPGMSYWVYALSCATVLLAFFVEGGAPISGWTAYTPLSAVPDAGPGQAAGQTIWIVAIALFTVSSMMGVLNYITTILQSRTKGMLMKRIPLNIWGMLSSSIISILVFPVLLGAGVLLLADRIAGTSFFVPAGLVMGDKLISHGGGHPLLWQHLFWFFGHPEVYIVIVPAMGIAAEILATFIRKPIFGYKIMAGC